MSEYTDFIASRLTERSADVAGFILILYLSLLGAARLYEVWRGLRTRRAVLEEEKLLCEITKLRYEIEAIRKLHGLPDLYSQALQPPKQAARPEQDRNSSGARIRLSLPDVPDLNLAPLISALRLRLRRPPVGLKRVFWCLKWLAVLALGTIVGIGLVIDLLPRETAEPALAVLVAATFLVGVFLAASALYSLLIASVAYVAAMRR